MWKKPLEPTTSLKPRLFNNKPFPFGANFMSVHIQFPKPDARLVVGHRGSSFAYPENTILAFDKAIEEGAKGIELDLWKTSDGEFAVVHDATVNRTTNGTGTISNLTWDYISGLDAGAWKGASFAGREDTKVPKFEAVLDRYKRKRIFLLVQSKMGLADTLQAIEKIKQKNMLEQCFIFVNRVLIKDIKRAYPTAYVMNDGNHTDTEDLLNQAIEEEWDGISNTPASLTEGLIDRAHDNKILVQASTITNNFAANTQNALNMGVNLILGDDCSAMVGVFESNGIEQIQPLFIDELEVKVFVNKNWETLN